MRPRRPVAAAMTCFSLCGALAVACTEPRFVDMDAALEDVQGGSEADARPEVDSGSSTALVGIDAGDAGGDTGQVVAQAMDGAVDAVEDAGPEAAAPEAGAHPHAEWFGRYAMRSYSYAADADFRPVGTLVSLVDIGARGPDDLAFVERPCVVEVEGSWNGLVPSSFRYEAPETQAPYTSTLVLDGDTFSTTPADFALGYDALAPAGCVPGATIARSTAQSGLSSTCECPLDQSLPPLNARDCRVTDPESDGNPGATVNVVVNTDVWTYFVVQHTRVRYVDGYRGREGLHANVDSQDVTRVLGCLPPALSSCPIAMSKPCPLRYNKAEFRPVDAAYDCKRVMRELDSLFPRAVPAYPLACLADL